jgi:multicomponent K+:H+ antiporter subunit E
MKRWLPFPVMWALLLAMWLVLNRTFGAGDVILGGAVAFGATLGLHALRAPQVVLRRPRAALELAWLVLADIVRSNVAVARIVLHRGTRNQTSGFVHIRLELKHPIGLAALACIITSTPGTAWGRYDSTRSILIMHILDLVDEETWIRTIKDRYERRLLEIFP